MQKGSYYYSNLPATIQEEFKSNCEAKFNTIMSADYDNLESMIDDAFNATYTRQGRKYWTHIAINYAPTLKTKAVNSLRGNRGVIVATLLIFIPAMFAIFIGALSAKNDTIKLQSKALVRANSINAINTANYIKDSIEDSKQPYMPESWKEQSRKERYEQMMDKAQNVEYDNSK